MSQVLGPLQQAIYVHSRLEPVGWPGQPGQRVNEPERAWPFVPAPAARIQTSTSPAPAAAANAPRLFRSDAVSPSDAGSPRARCAHAGWQCAPDGRDRCHAGRSAHRRTGVLAVWWTRRDAILDLRRGDVRYLWGHRETDELKGCCLSDDLVMQEGICLCIAWTACMCSTTVLLSLMQVLRMDLLNRWPSTR
jgi:hypothetical protein